MRQSEGVGSASPNRENNVMQFSLVKIEDVIVVELTGDVWGGWDSVELKDSVGRLLTTGERKFLVDFSACGSVNSSGIGVLLAVQEAIRNVRGTMALCEVNERARRAFSISEVWNEFDSKVSRDEGLKAMGISESNP
jgi:anti-sigma B factor antagonist